MKKLLKILAAIATAIVLLFAVTQVFAYSAGIGRVIPAVWYGPPIQEKRIVRV